MKGIAWWSNEKKRITYLLAPLAWGSAVRRLRRGLGSWGLDILCFLGEGGTFCFDSEALDSRGAAALRPNHLLGFERNPVMPEEGELERGNE